ncbi:MAG TPA: hypothetical protein VMW45_04335 [Dehalococcoidia bacterium]|nr:hypothetical protein [Dehalococcoidia bacterium]
MEIQKIVAEVDFNYDQDKKRFGMGDKIVHLNRFTNEEGQEVLGITFELGVKEDDTMNLILPYKEFAEKVGSLTIEP